MTREKIRKQLREPYRTLVGHLRHEVGHYYWDRLVDNTPDLMPYRELFGDERANYEEALKRYYEQGPAPIGRLFSVSAYASVHPWEDWAETWAHYMHMLDTLSTASSFGLSAQSVEMPFVPFTLHALWEPGRRQGIFPGVVEFVDEADGRAKRTLQKHGPTRLLSIYAAYVYDPETTFRSLRDSRRTV